MTGLAMWWTAEPALIRLVNRDPEPVELSAARQPRATLRWVEVTGLELRLDRTLLLRPEAPTLPPVVLFLEPSDPCARFWARTRAWVDLAEGSAGTASLGGFLNALGPAAERLLSRRYAELQQDPEEALPAPERALLIQHAAPAPLTQARGQAGSDLAAFWDLQHVRNLQVRSAVGLRTLKGVLDPTPKTFLARLEGELGIRPAGYLIQAEVRPSEFETRVFGAASLILVFLVAGLWGAAQTGAEGKKGKQKAGDPSEPQASSEPALPSASGSDPT